ncbi:MAG TPA: glycosyltransferase family 4 protein [Polyangiales bacterium]|jgi:glycosyltransferase involved in cell wall biosynthesis|nr:glycosyltransferase family 4 protein [Polyangiales bacterium]
MRRVAVRTAAFITATELEPRIYGKSVVIGGIMDHLCERLGAERVHLVLVGRPELERPPVAYQRHLVTKPAPLDQVRAVLQHVVLPPLGLARVRLSLQEAALRSNSVEKGIRALLDEIDPDLEIWDTVRVGQYAQSVPRRNGIADPQDPTQKLPTRPFRKLLYADDLFSERYTAMLRDSQTRELSGNPGGEFKKLLPRPLGALLGNPSVYRPLLRLERKLVASSEERQPPWFDATYLVGAGEAARLRERCPGSKVEILPPLLREPHQLHRRTPSAPVFTFLGGFDYAPNLDGISWFLEVCKDAVLAALPDVRIQVVGAGTERGLPQAAAWGDRVSFLGWVDDLDAVLGNSVALLSPLRTGSGVKIKVLEALARGLPVVATPSGVQGIEADESTGCLVGATPEDLAASMRMAFDPEVNLRLSKAARRAWDHTYSPHVVRAQYDEIFGLSTGVSVPTAADVEAGAPEQGW